MIAPADTEAEAFLAEALAGVPPVTAPVSTAPADIASARPLRDAKGRFLPGGPGGPGRRPGQGLDLRALAEREAEREGFDLNQAAWRVLKKLFHMAEGGDVAAAKLVLDKLGVVDEAQQAGITLTVVTGVDADGQPAQGIALRMAPRTGDTEA